MPWTDAGLAVRGQLIASSAEIDVLREEIGDDLTISSTLAAWLGGDEVPPHSVGVALETQLRMLFGDAPNAKEVLGRLIARLAETFPSEVQPLDTG